MINYISVLLVEDNRVSRLVAERLLKLWNYSVKVAANGHEALALVALESYDLILMNLGMPGLNGWETARLIRKVNLHYQHIPIIALSASVIDLKKTKNLFTDFLQIPYMPEQLKNLLQQHTKSVVTAEAVPQIQSRLDAVSGSDPHFRQQLIRLFSKNCKDLVEDLLMGRLDNAEYLSQVRHKHRSSLRLLELYSLEAALDSLQEALNTGLSDSALLLQRKQTVIQQATAIMQGLSRQAA